jgi:hypothetical protein
MSMINPRTTTPLCVVQTYCKFPADGGAVYEVHLASDDEAGARRLTLITPNPDLYAQALAAEGTAQRFRARWQPIEIAGRRDRLGLLEALEAVP